MSEKKFNPHQCEQSDNLSQDELKLELEKAKSETIKYANKFLESQQKWGFINFLLKELNSIREKQMLCNTICEGFLKLTNSKVCACRLFDNDNFQIEFKEIAYLQNNEEEKVYDDFISKIDASCINFIEKSIKINEINEYFNSISESNIIALPISFSGSLLGYLILIKEDKNFNSQNIHFINIFPEHIALILENISHYQESEKRNKQKIEFLAGISHEFKTPLNSIIGFSDILKLKLQNVELLRYLENISHSSSHLLTLIDDVLDVAKSQVTLLELKYTTFSPKKSITQIITALENMCKEKNIELTYTLTDIKISADERRFKQLIYNLLSNAVKFNKQNGKIKIISYVKDDYFFFEIEDTGDGISKKDYDKIFDFFTQVNRNQLKREKGSGIGLALCKMIIHAHQGQIDFKSQLGQGSCFWFGLPLERLASGEY